MFKDFSILPESASTIASRVDHLYFFLIGVSLFFFLLVSILVLVFAIRYRKRAGGDGPTPIHGSLGLELLWTVIPFGLSMIMFAWGVVIYFDMYSPPPEAMNVYVVGKQWMWKIQHPEGNREINELHVPLGTPVRLIMTSEDVIHSFYVPAFRMKMDVLPGKYTSAWFQATETGQFHLFCAEYCGTKHSEMIGKIYVLDPVEYEDWLNRATAATQTMAQAGEDIFSKLGCVTCHSEESGARGPSLQGIYGTQVRTIDGSEVKVDDDYIRQSILKPADHITEGFAPIMPTFKGQASEEDVLKLISYIKSLGAVGPISNAPDRGGN